MKEGSEERRVETKRRSRWDGVFATSRNLGIIHISTSKRVGGRLAEPDQMGRGRPSMRAAFY